MTDTKAFIHHVRVSVKRNPDWTLEHAARRVRFAYPYLTARVLDTIGMYPSSEPELLALQTIS